VSKNNDAMRLILQQKKAISDDIRSHRSIGERSLNSWFFSGLAPMVWQAGHPTQSDRQPAAVLQHCCAKTTA